MMRMLKDVGLVEQLGFGMNRILRAYDRDIFQIPEHFIKAVFLMQRVGMQQSSPLAMKLAMKLAMIKKSLDC